MSSAIEYLSAKKCSFLFATHIHELYQLESIKKLENIKIFHLSAHFDKEKNYLVFDRILKQGGGNILYGLEIAKSLDLPEDFLFKAEDIRKEYTNTKKDIIVPKKSTYNSNVFYSNCSICNKDTQNKDIHHITEQQYANSKGILEEKQIHKNIKHNLINVCEDCHNKIHSNEIKINGYIQTNKGIQLDVQIDKEISNKKPDIIIRIKELRNKGKSYATILNIINNEFEDKITLYKLKKLLQI